jgi:PKD repeat protein
MQTQRKNASSLTLLGLVLIFAIYADRAVGEPTWQGAYFDVTFESGSAVYAAATERLGDDGLYVSVTDNPLGPFTQQPVHFRGLALGGEQLVYRYRIDFHQPVMLNDITVRGAAWLGFPSDVVKLLDSEGFELASVDVPIPAQGSNSNQDVILDAAGVTGTTFYLEEYNDDQDWRYRSHILIDFTPLPSFDDVPDDYWAFDHVEMLYDSGITGGCGSGFFCPDAPITRAQMAVFLVRAMHGSDFRPPPAAGNVFLDVGIDDFAAAFIEQLYHDGITGGCGNNNFCPGDPVTRAQMAVFLLRAMHGPGYSPPPATGVFDDVDLAYWAVAWIEQLAAEGITFGCGNNNYCPDSLVTRAQMAVFMVRALTLDAIPPVITLSGPNPQLLIAGTSYTELGATALDNFDGNLTNSIVIDSSAVDTSVPGAYVVTYAVSDSSGNAAITVSRTILVRSQEENLPPYALFVASPDSGYVPLSVEFDASASSDQDGTIVEYAWDFGDGELGDGSTPYAAHVYEQPGEYTVSLTVSDAYGAQGTATRIVTATAQEVRWLGTYQSSLISETRLSSESLVTGDSITGTFEDEAGRQGTISATVVGTDVTLQIEQTNSDCLGSFTGTGVLSSSTLFGNASLAFVFSGTNCEGEHTDGSGVLFQQAGEVLAWGQDLPSNLQLRGNELFWSNDSPDAINKLDISTLDHTVLAPRMVAINSVLADGTRLLWTDLDDDGPSGCIGSQVARTLYVSNPDGSNPRRLDSGSYCAANRGTEQIFTDGTYVYWAKVAPYERSIERVPLAGGSPEILAQPGDGLQGFAIDSQYFYWGEVVTTLYTAIYRCPLSGCGQQAPEQILATDESIEMWSDFVITGDLIVLGIKRIGQLGYEISTLPKDGGVLTDIAHSDGQILRVLADSTHAYWVSGGIYGGIEGLFRAPLSGGDETLLVSPFEWSRDIALGEDRVYFTHPTWPIDFEAEVRYVPKAGGTVQTLVPGLASPYRLAVEPGGAVICVDNDFGIYRISPTGELTGMLVGFDAASQLTVDDFNVYGTQGFTIKRISRDGASGGVVAPSYFYVAGIDNDGSYVYWLDEGMATVYRALADQAGDAEFVSTGSGLGVDLVVGGGYVYWIEGYENLYRAPSSGGTAERLASDLAWGIRLEVDEEYVYIIESGANQVTRMPVTGGERTALGPVGCPAESCAMTQDSAHLYLANSWGLSRITKEDGSMTVYEIPTFFSSSYEASIAVDDLYIYWSEPGLGAIKRELK